ncbi:A-kinase anchor protein SPHKAP isoform B [Alligator mississippiensis]|uniref:A-kinase anchor protein SPHKAP isoform B n=1 Tax=Alligator mississippiensis TaxID=8496 RepID=A0A151NAP1_ALLMI|nr:A-kinase anchor protein SPHKAP isoform B [Alligator mississippiensis]
MPSSNFECPLMYEVSENQGSGTDSSGSSLDSCVTACKKILCSNSLLESTDYWLQNQRTPCRIGFLEDKSENSCASVCFVNLDAKKDDCSDEQLKQRLISVSPNLPKLISSMNVQPPKENEIILLSGLTSGNLRTDFEVPQCSWLTDVCLVQCARGDRKNSTSCIIFEINKFLIGLELVQERQLQIEASVLKPEDDTNCSVSSIEEDFLTASEHLEDENETDEYKNGHEKLNVTELVSDPRKHKGKGLENLHYRKARLPFTLDKNCVNTENVASAKTSGNSEAAVNVVAEDHLLPSGDKLIQELHWKNDLAGRASSSHSTKSLEDSLTGEAENTCPVCTSEDASLTIMAKEELTSLHDTVSKQNSKVNAEDITCERQPHSALPNEQATTGQYATNLAESVLQDAFIRLSQSQPTFMEEAAVSISIGNSLNSATCTNEDVTTSRSWNELPKIVIVQSPDSYENTSEWPGSGFPNLCHWSESENSEASDYLEEDSSNGNSQGALEVALACAATVIGTISSPKATERFKREQESTDSQSEIVDNEELQTKSSQGLDGCADLEYSFPSALCGMTQVASAVAVCGLSETKEDKYPVTSSGLLSAAEASAAITLHCSIAIGSSMEKLNDSIAEALLKEASIILTKPNTYKNIGDFMESINGRIIKTATSPQISHVDEMMSDELAQNLSNIILRHSVEEVKKKRQLHPRPDSKSNAYDIFMDTANELLFNVIYFTCKKMSDIAQIETDQREDLDKDPEPLTASSIPCGKAKEHANKEKPPEASSGKHMVSSCLINSSISTRTGTDAETVVETKTAEEFPNPLSSSDESMGSWSQLVNDEDNPDDTSSYLQLSERSMSELIEEKMFLKEQPENTEESTSGLSVGTSNCQKDLLVINFDLEPECPDAELRATLQWIAASELGIPTIYFKKSQENRIEKFLDVVQLVHQKSWKVGDIFHAVVQYCKLHEESRELTPSLFDWLLELG